MRYEIGMSPTISAFKQVPPPAQGLVRDLRVRWALEEAGQRYEERLVTLGEEQTSPAYLEWQPFGQVPAFREDDLQLFESGAIALHIAERAPELMPDDGKQRELVRAWLFAALNTIEPPITMINYLDQQKVDRGSDIAKSVMGWGEKRLRQLAEHLGDDEYLVAGRFSVADLLMVTVLRGLRQTDLLAKVPSIDAYKKRGEARPAFKRALADQMRVFEKNPPMPMPDG
jgi:glutathione S-transferase